MKEEENTVEVEIDNSAYGTLKSYLGATMADSLKPLLAQLVMDAKAEEHERIQTFYKPLIEKYEECIRELRLQMAKSEKFAEEILSDIHSL